MAAMRVGVVAVSVAVFALFLCVSFALSEESADGEAVVDVVDDSDSGSGVKVPYVKWSQTKEKLRLQFTHKCQSAPSISFTQRSMNFTCDEGETHMELFFREDITDDSACAKDGDDVVLCNLVKKEAHTFDRLLFYASDYNKHVSVDWDRYTPSNEIDDNAEDFSSIIDESNVQLWNFETFKEAEKKFDVLVFHSSYSWCKLCRYALQHVAKTAKKFSKSKRVGVGAIDLLESPGLRDDFDAPCDGKCIITIADTLTNHVYNIDSSPDYDAFKQKVDRYTAPPMKKMKSVNSVWKWIKKVQQDNKKQQEYGRTQDPNQNIAVVGVFDDRDTDMFKAFREWARENKGMFRVGIMNSTNEILGPTIAIFRDMDKGIESMSLFELQFNNITKWVQERTLPLLHKSNNDLDAEILESNRYTAHLCVEKEEDVDEYFSQLIKPAAEKFRGRMVVTYVVHGRDNACNEYGFYSKKAPLFGLTYHNMSIQYEQRYALLKQNFTSEDVIEFSEKVLEGELEENVRSEPVDGFDQPEEGDYYNLYHDCWHTLKESVESRDFLLLALYAERMVQWEDVEEVIKQVRLALGGVLDVHVYNIMRNHGTKEYFGKPTRTVKFLLFRGSMNRAKVFKGSPKRSELLKWVRKSVPHVKENWPTVEDNLKIVKQKVEEYKNEKENRIIRYQKMVEGLEEERIKEDGGILRHIETKGTGRSVEKGDVVSATYVGYLEDGTIFDDNNSKTPMDLPVGNGNIIPCWDEGFIGMRIGDVGYITCKSEYAYGERGQGKIPSGSTLRFKVEVKDRRINDDEAANIPKYDASRDSQEQQ
eukprot:m.75576 g.75576  ORF g.75576 m.75576 type:complete len:816 (-) comp11848_c0_seq4:298-2745(-)